jgi:hypothetical protein
MKAACPAIQNRFRRLVNMSPSEIRAWAKDPRAKLASFESTRRRLPALADLAAKRGGWTLKDCSFAQRVNSFNARMQGMVGVHGCTDKMTVALRNWGRQPPGCKLPKR